MTIWQRAAPSTAATTSKGIWEVPNPYDPSRFKPRRIDEWEIKKFEPIQGETYFVLKNKRRISYLKLTETQAALWELMDGTRTVQELAMENFLRTHTLAIEGLLSLVDQLRLKGFLNTPPTTDVYYAVARQRARQSPSYWLRRALGWVFQSELAIHGIDRYVGWIYRLGERLLFTRPLQVLFLLLTIVGVPVFFLVVKRGDLSFFVGGHGRLEVGLVTLLAAEIFAVFTHELSHALTVKHYRREVRRGGVGLYFGMVAFFVDTTDMWMAERKPRLAVTWAGPYSGFILGAVASLMLMIHPFSGFIYGLIDAFPALGHFYLNTVLPIAEHRSVWAGLTYQFATFCFAISFLNLNPLLKLDGYYLLMDGLDIPQLRERSIEFVRGPLRRKLRQRSAFSREERIFSVFGVLALAWTGIAIFSILLLYGGRLYAWTAGLVGPQWAGWLLGVSGALVLIWYARRYFRAAKRPV